MQVLRLSVSHQRLTSLRQIRNLARLIWVNVALPPADSPQNPRANAPVPDLTAFALRRRKVRVIKLCLGFSFATKVSYLLAGIHFVC
jgi:putative membrane protein